MMRISMLLMMLVSQSHSLEISYFDSVTNPKVSWVLVDGCAVEVPKARVKDTCYVAKKVSDFCHLGLKLDECNAKNKK